MFADEYKYAMFF